MAYGLQVKLPYEGADANLEHLALIKTNIGGYFFDGFLTVDHSVNSVMTSHQVQKGANVSDHAYIEPVELTMTIMMSDTMKGMVESQFENISYTRSVAAYVILRELQMSRIAMQVNTRIETYQNMIITGLSVSDTYEDYTRLKCTVRMKQLLVAEEKKIKISAREQVTTTSNSGTVFGTREDESILYQNREFADAIMERFGYVRGA